MSAVAETKIGARELLFHQTKENTPRHTAALLPRACDVHKAIPCAEHVGVLEQAQLVVDVDELIVKIADEMPPCRKRLILVLMAHPRHEAHNDGALSVHPRKGIGPTIERVSQQH